MSSEILIIDDNADIRSILKDLIDEAGFKTRVAANYNQALKEIDKKLPDVAIIDVKLDKGDNDGIELLLHIKKKNKDIPVIIISGHANIEMAIKSLKSGAFEFIQKPFDRERLMNFVNRAVENYKLINENKNLKTQLFHSFNLIGSSQNIEQIKNQIDKFSTSESRIFISGPTGSGKELVARKIHKNSSRNKGPFIILNGALLDVKKYELELFGGRSGLLQAAWLAGSWAPSSCQYRSWDPSSEPAEEPSWALCSEKEEKVRTCGTPCAPAGVPPPAACWESSAKSAGEY